MMLELSDTAKEWLEARLVDVCEQAMGRDSGERMQSTPRDTAAFQSALDRVWLDMARCGLILTHEAKEHRLVCGNPWIDPLYQELGRDIQQLTVSMVAGDDVWTRDPEELFKGEKPMQRDTPEQCTTEPIYQHDCTECVFKGTVAENNGHPVDIYRCEQRGLPTWAARYGHAGPAYTTLPESMVAGMPEGSHPHWDLILPFARAHLSNPELW